MDDLSMVVNVSGKGLVIVVGYGHAGIVNIISSSIKINCLLKPECHTTVEIPSLSAFDKKYTALLVFLTLLVCSSLSQLFHVLYK
jgi:hypothetical protein